MDNVIFAVNSGGEAHIDIHGKVQWNDFQKMSKECFFKGYDTEKIRLKRVSLRIMDEVF